MQWNGARFFISLASTVAAPKHSDQRKLIVNKIWCEWSVCSMQVIHFNLNFLNHINVSGPNKTLHVYSPDSVAFFSFSSIHYMIIALLNYMCLENGNLLLRFPLSDANSFQFRLNSGTRTENNKKIAFRLTLMINWSQSPFIDHCVQLADFAVKTLCFKNEREQNIKIRSFFCFDFMNEK